MIWVFEKLVRIHDQLDEQLHAGFYFYILTSPSKFVSSAVFIWPILLIVYGACIPVWLDYMHIVESRKLTDWTSRKQAAIFLVSLYATAALIFITPWLLLNKESCYTKADQSQKAKATQLVLIIASVSSLVLLIGSKVYRTKESQYVWLEVRLLQTWVNTALIALFSLFTYPFALFIALFQITLLFARPVHNPEGLPLVKWAVESSRSVIWVALSLSATILLLFGCVKGNVVDNLQEYVGEAMRS